MVEQKVVFPARLADLQPHPSASEPWKPIIHGMQVKRTKFRVEEKLKEWRRQGWLHWLRKPEP